MKNKKIFFFKWHANKEEQLNDKMVTRLTLSSSKARLKEFGEMKTRTAAGRYSYTHVRYIKMIIIKRAW